jgi:DNA-binding transcriptional MerR regulator
MKYTINKLGKIAGVTTRTLRYYDAIGLLKPESIHESGYRVYGQEQVDKLQQILFYRELGMELRDIAGIVNGRSFDRMQALSGHLEALKAKRRTLDALIRNVEKTISAGKGGTKMTDKEKFEGFKDELIKQNEETYGKEARGKYGDDIVDASNKKIKGMTPQHYEEVERLSAELNETLKAAYLTGDPAGELAQKACGLHKRWLMFFWDSYSREAHMGLAQMYVDDERFSAYYDRIAPGCARFLRDAIMIYCK